MKIAFTITRSKENADIEKIKKQLDDSYAIVKENRFQCSYLASSGFLWYIVC